MSRNEKALEKLVQEYMEKGDPSLDHLILAYIHLQEAFKESKVNEEIYKKYGWASDEVENILDVRLAFLLVEKCQDLSELAWVTAGPLKDIIQRNPEDIREILDIMTRKSTKMRKALEGLWLNPTDKAYPLFIELINKYGLMERSW